MNDAGRGGPEVRGAGALRAADRATQFVERPVRRVSGAARFNPLPHAGTISVFLLGIVVLSGLYITLFFEFGFAASYDSVEAMEDHAIQRVVRALHRYASAALVLTSLVHAWRIVTAGRFVGPRRRWRWATGLASLLVVWLAGVTGYWLVWDRRAGALNEATAALLRPFDAGSRYAVRNLLGVSPGSGSGLLLLIWFLHLILTAVIGWFLYRHLRRSKQPWLPPRHFMALMGVALVVLSVVVPVGMLGPARPDRLVADMPLDPFVLFLLPPLLSDWRWVAVLVGLAAVALAFGLPRLLTRRDPAVVEIDEQACTGCDLCVLDCPYDALSMVPLGDRRVAELEADQCVACGICIGSCAFDAITFPGEVPLVAPEVGGRPVIVVCDRHDAAALGGADGEAVVMPVRCAGMLAPTLVRSLGERGATEVRLVGCAPADCRYGTGNTLADERIAGERAPHPPRRYQPLLATDWRALGDVDVVPGAGSRDDGAAGGEGRRYAAPALVVFLSMMGVVAATRAPFDAAGSRAGLRVVVDHRAGAPLVGVDRSPGALERVEIVLDGVSLGERGIPTAGGVSAGYADWRVDPGPHELRVVAHGAGESVTLFDDVVVVDPGERFVVVAGDVPEPPGAGAGRDVFTSRRAGCTVCHSVDRGDDGVGPTLYGIADVAADRVEGLDAAGYMRQSILLPDQYVVDGWPAGQMLPIYRERLDEQELEALITYLLTLEGVGS